MNQINWNWKKFKLILPGFMVLRLYTEQDIVEISLKIEENPRESKELIIKYSLDAFGKFIKSLRKIIKEVEEKDFKNKVLEYNILSTGKILIGLYFTKDDFLKFYKFLGNCQGEIIEQARAYRELAKGE